MFSFSCGGEKGEGGGIGGIGKKGGSNDRTKKVTGG